jgi:hypothetical protein
VPCLALRQRASAAATGLGCDAALNPVQAHVGGDAEQAKGGLSPQRGSDHRDGAARLALKSFGDRKGFDGRHKAHLFDGLAAAAKELLFTGVGTAFDAIGIEVNHHAADLAAGSGKGLDGHGTGARDPTVQPGVRGCRQGRRHAACVALANASRLGTVLGPLAAVLPLAMVLGSNCCRSARESGDHAYFDGISGRLEIQRQPRNDCLPGQG